MAYPNKNIQTQSTHNDLSQYYLAINMNNICRVCLEKSNKLTLIFDPIKPPHFSVLLMACASVQVEDGDGLPPFICQRCISRLNIAFQFKTMCEASDTKLRQCAQSYNVHQLNSLAGYQRKGQIGPTTNSTQQGVKQIQIEEPPPYNANINNEEQVVYTECQTSEGKYKDLNIIDVEEGSIEESTKPHDIEEYTKDNNTVMLEDLNIQHMTTNTPDIIKEKKIKVHECSTCGKIFKTKPSLVHHVRIHTGERPYVCHLCQKRFVNGGHLHTHMKTHTGEKNHVCAACNKAFATTQQLTKHTIAIHTSERPYGCTYCAKRFASSSNLNTHIKIHTGEKNFHCEFCGKTFSTKGQLQQHMLVHTGEKAFLCEYCNKRFSQKAHVLRHLKIHNRTE